MGPSIFQGKQEVDDDIGICVLNLYESRYINFLNCTVTLRWSYDQRVIQHVGQKSTTVIQPVASFGVHGCSAGGETMYLIFHVTSQDLLIKSTDKFGDQTL